MKKCTITRFVLFAALFLGGSPFLYAWGVWAHQRINRAAVFALPAEMRTFFYNHIDFLTVESVIPDVRKYAISDKAESPRHYIDLEDFGQHALDSLPKNWKEASQKYDEKTLQRNGILPWYIVEIQNKLVTAFREKRKDEILFLAADLGHYLGDAHVPLHTSSNHDGQLTGQKGIHAFWESQLPEHFGEAYRFNTGEAKYISDPVAEVWRIIEDSHLSADTLLKVDKQLQNDFAKDKIFQLDSLGNMRKNKYGQGIHSKEYAAKYHQLLNGMIERRIRLSIAATANFWYTAWVNAGKPDLNSMDSEATTKSNARNFKAETKLWKQGKLIEMNYHREF